MPPTIVLLIMSPIYALGLLSLGPIISYLLVTFELNYFTPQIIALLIIISIFAFKKSKVLFIIHTSYIINLLISSTGSTQSPVFFLFYFLIFLLGFQFQLNLVLAYSLVVLLVQSQTVNSFTTFIALFSLVFTVPVVWFTKALELTIQSEETDFQLWSSLKLRTGLNRIVDAARCLHLTNITSDQKRLTKTITDTTSSLLSSLDNLKKDL